MTAVTGTPAYSGTGHGLILAVGDLPDGGATAMRIRLIARALHEGGVSVRVGLVHATAKHVIEGNEKVNGDVDGIPYVYLSGSPVRPTARLSALMDTLKGTVHAIAALWRRPSFVIFYTPIFTKLGPLIFLAKILRIDTYVEICEIWSSAPRLDRTGRKRRFLFAGGRKFEKALPRMCSGIIVISDTIRRYFESLGAQREQLFLLPILVDADIYAQRSVQSVEMLNRKRFFFNSGSFSEKDGAIYIVRAFAVAAKNDPEVYLVFSGNADQAVRRILLEQLDDKAVAGRILFTGYLLRDQLIWCYQNALALLSCRPDNAFARYGFPTKLGEYLASGTVVIATRVGDVERYLVDKECAVLARPEDVEDIAACMQWVVDNLEKARVIGGRGRCVAVDCFDFRAHMKSLSEFVMQGRDR